MEEERVVRLRVTDKPLHSSKLGDSYNQDKKLQEYKATAYHVLPRGNLTRVLRIVCQQDYILLLVAPQLCNGMSFFQMKERGWTFL